MSFDLEKLQAVADLGEVIRLQNEALDRLVAFRKARPYMVMPNLMKVVEENLKENLQVLYKEFNNLHKPAEQQTRYICKECNMAFLVKLPGGICDECRARLATKPRDYVPYNPSADEDQGAPEESDMIADAQEGSAADEEAAEDIAADAENAAAGDKEPVEAESEVTEESTPQPADADTEALSDEFQQFLTKASGAQDSDEDVKTESADTDGPEDVAEESDETATQHEKLDDKYRNP